MGFLVSLVSLVSSVELSAPGLEDVALDFVSSFAAFTLFQIEFGPGASSGAGLDAFARTEDGVAAGADVVAAAAIGVCPLR